MSSMPITEAGKVAFAAVSDSAHVSAAAAAAAVATGHTQPPFFGRTDDDAGTIAAPRCWQRCAVCLRPSDAAGDVRLKRCTSCGVVSYCGRNCQRIDWKKRHHREECEKLRACRERRTRLVALMASHVDSAERMQYVCHCLKSVVDQVLPPSAFYLSWSCAPEVDRDMCATIIDGVGAAIRGFRAFYRAKPAMGQFEHYASLCEHVGGGGDADGCWLMFSDDDDLWDHLRALSYWAVLGSAQCVGCPRVASVRSLAFAARTDDRDVAAAAEAFQPTSAAEVTKAIERGLVRPQQADAHRQGDYVHYCVRAPVFAQFFERVPGELLAHRLCDVAFANYVRCYDGGGGDDDYHTVQFTAPGWMYYCRDHGDYTHAAEPQRDRPAEKAARAQLRAAQPHDLSDDEVEHVAALIVTNVELDYVSGLSVEQAADCELAAAAAARLVKTRRRHRQRRRIRAAVVSVVRARYAELKQRWGTTWVQWLPS